MHFLKGGSFVKILCNSVWDPGDVYPGSGFFLSRIPGFSIRVPDPDPGSGFAT
jgi:hypothetical protein